MSADVTTEDPIHEGAANFQKNVETVGGKLFLFKDRLIFEPHTLNVQKEPVSIQLQSISEINLGWTKLFGFIPLIPNALIIIVGSQQYRFTVFNRKLWLEKIRNH